MDKQELHTTDEIVSVQLEDDREIYVRILSWCIKEGDPSADNPTDFYGYTEVDWEYLCTGIWNEYEDVEEYIFEDNIDFSCEEEDLIDSYCRSRVGYLSQRAYELSRG